MRAYDKTDPAVFYRSGSFLCLDVKNAVLLLFTLGYVCITERLNVLITKTPAIPSDIFFLFYKIEPSIRKI